MKKRYRSVNAREGQLLVKYGKLPYDEPDLIYAWGEGTSKADGNLLVHYISGKRYSPFNKKWEDSLVEELEKRGYDITTLKISIQKKI